MDSSGNTTHLQLCDPYIWEDPRYMFRSTWFDRYLTESSSVCASALVNKVFFVYIVACLIATLASFVVKVPALVGIAGILATVYLIPTFMKLRSVSLYKEEANQGSSASSASPASRGSEGFRPSASMQQTRPQAWGPMPDDLTGPKAAYETSKGEELDCQRNPFKLIVI